ncbi:MAG: alkaline phosphatase [Anaerolineae bacterium]
MPNLNRLRQNGASSLTAQTVEMPAATLIAHASMLSGMTPDLHGIYWNEHAPDLGKVRGPTVFSVAHDAGKRTAMIVGKVKLDHINLPNSVDYWYVGDSDLDVKNHAVNMIQTEPELPNVFFIHFPDVDWQGHKTGWESDEQNAVISRTDGYVDDIVQALNAKGYLETTLIIVTSDHGGHEMSHYSDSPEDRTIPWLAIGPGVPRGVPLERPINIQDTAPTVLSALNLTPPPPWNGQVITEIFNGRASP